MAGQVEHPLRLVGWLRQKHRLKGRLTTEELIAILEHAQLTIEEKWHWAGASDTFNCGFLGCNYHRYPASRFCMYHVTAHDAFAARLRRSISRDRKRGIDVAQYEGVLRLVTENVVGIPEH